MTTKKTKTNKWIKVTGYWPMATSTGRVIGNIEYEIKMRMPGKIKRMLY